MIAEWFPMLLGMTNASFRRLSAVPVCARHIHETRDCTMSCSQSSHTSLQWMRLARVGSTAGCNQALQTSKYRELHGPTLLNGRAAIQHQPEMILHLSSNSSGAPVTDCWANKFLMPGVLPSKSKQNKCWTGLPWTHPNWSEPGRRFDPLILPHLEQKWNVFDVFTFLGIGIFELEDFWFCRSCWCILSASHVESVLNLCFPRKNNYQGLILRCDKFHKCNHSVIKMSEVWWCLMFPTDQTEPQSLSYKRWTAQRFFLSAKRSCRRPASISTRMTSKCYMHFLERLKNLKTYENIWKYVFLSLHVEILSSSMGCNESVLCFETFRNGTMKCCELWDIWMGYLGYWGTVRCPMFGQLDLARNPLEESSTLAAKAIKAIWWHFHPYMATATSQQHQQQLQNITYRILIRFIRKLGDWNPLLVHPKHV